MFESSNRREFQKGLDTEKARINRHKNQLSLRREQRAQHLKKKRRAINGHSTMPNNQGTKVCIKDVGKYISMIMSNDESQHFNGTQAFRILLCVERDPPTQRVMETGCVPNIIRFMKTSKNENLRFEAAWVITNIAAGSSQFCIPVCKMGAIDALVHVFRTSNDANAIEQAVWGLGNIAGDNPDCRNAVVKTGVLQDLVERFHKFHPEMSRNAMWTISNIARTVKSAQFDTSEFSILLPLLEQIFLESTDPQLLGDAAWTCVYLTNLDSPQLYKQLQSTNIVPNVAKLLLKEKTKWEVALAQKGIDLHSFEDCKNMDFQDIINASQSCLSAMNQMLTQPIMRFLGNVATGDDDQTQSIINNGVLQMIDPFLVHSIAMIRKETFWFVSNIVAGNHQQIESVLSRPFLLKSIIHSCKFDVTSVRREAAWCISNSIIDSTSCQKKKLVEAEAVHALCSLLTMEGSHFSSKDKTLTMILEAMDLFLSLYLNSDINPICDIMEECKGLDKLEEIQGDENISEETYMHITDLIQRYWGIDDGEVVADDTKEQKLLQDKLNPTIEGNQFTFGTKMNQENVNTFNKQISNNNGNNGNNGNNSNNNNNFNAFQYNF